MTPSLQGKSADFPPLRQNSKATRDLSRPGYTRASPPPFGRGAATQPVHEARRRAPASPKRDPAAPALLPGLPTAIRPGGTPSIPSQPLSRVLSPGYLSRAAATILLHRLRRPTWHSRGLAANHPISAPSQCQADHSVAFSGQEAGTESPEWKARLPPRTPPAASHSRCAHARGGARCVSFRLDFALWPHCSSPTSCSERAGRPTFRT